MSTLSTVKQQLAVLATLREQEQVNLQIKFCKEDAKPLLDLWEFELKEHLNQGSDTQEWRMLDFESQMKLNLLEAVLSRLLESIKAQAAREAFKDGKATTGKNLERLK